MPSRGLTLFLRLSLAAGFLSSVADRFGLWGPPGSRYASWGDFEHFLTYASKVNAFLPAVAQRPLAWAATVAETVLGLALLAGLGTRPAARASGWLLLVFALAMTLSTGLKSALAYSVFPASAAAFLLAAVPSESLGLDAWLGRSPVPQPAKET